MSDASGMSFAWSEKIGKRAEKFGLYDYRDWAGAKNECQRAIKLDPSNPNHKAIRLGISGVRFCKGGEANEKNVLR
jgi:hypothetical protein